ncbi:hypothetical protein CJF31_00009703 [Rutstroemia sp. NJR-2017a BVV2]|nr:hypothetical protein CJF31_00009703 [Rutstroemia sp. NJR-2017a BVV2]
MPSTLSLDDKQHSVEGHIFVGTLTFDGRKIWERSCHDNTVALGQALEKIDPRFRMSFEKKDKTNEGHTKTITLKDKNGNTLVDKLSTHDNMHDLVVSVNALTTALDL